MVLRQKVTSTDPIEPARSFALTIVRANKNDAASIKRMPRWVLVM
jgi:hypothetical protein